MPKSHRRGFTLVEMLVVIAIIAVLAALLLPAVNRVLSTGRNAAIAVEINQLASAVEAYKQDKGDYPPNFRDVSVVTRHIRKCYPKIDPTYMTYFLARAFPATGSAIGIDEGESLVFWLSMTDTDPRYPFLSYPVYDASSKLYPATSTPNPKKYYDFDQSRIRTATADGVGSFQAKYCKETFYIYIDSRSYVDTCRFTTTPYGETVATTAYAYAEDNTIGIRPYWSTTTSGITTPANLRTTFKPMNATTFQILCAGQDGDFGLLMPGDVDVKTFPTSANANQSYNDGDNDNITNFSNGKTLKDNIPQ